MQYVTDEQQLRKELRDALGDVMAAEYWFIRSELLNRGEPLFRTPESRPICGWCGAVFEKGKHGMKKYCTPECRSGAEQARKKIGNV